MPETLFVGDPHFGHGNIIRLAKRKPFEDVEAMDVALIRNWNAMVNDDDTVYVLGDFALCKGNRTKPSTYFYALKGRKILIRGNHDRDKTFRLPWDEVYREGQRIVTIEGRLITLNHCSMQVWEGSHRGAWHLFAHSHGNCTPVGCSFDVGVDALATWRASVRESREFATRDDSIPFLRAEDFAPISFTDVKRRMEKIKATIVDHHGRNDR